MSQHALFDLSKRPTGLTSFVLVVSVKGHLVGYAADRCYRGAGSRGRRWGTWGSVSCQTKDGTRRRNALWEENGYFPWQPS